MFVIPGLSSVLKPSIVVQPSCTMPKHEAQSSFFEDFQYNKETQQYILECTANFVILGLHSIKKLYLFDQTCTAKDCIKYSWTKSPSMAAVIESWYILDKRTFLQYIKCRFEIAVSDLFYVLQASIKNLQAFRFKKSANIIQCIGDRALNLGTIIFY